MGVEGMLDQTDKAERYWGLMRKYHDLAEHAEPPFLGDFYLKVAARYRAMAKEAFDRVDAKARCKEKSSQPSGES
jgi:hypothetical protein